MGAPGAVARAILWQELESVRWRSVVRIAGAAQHAVRSGCCVPVCPGLPRCVVWLSAGAVVAVVAAAAVQRPEPMAVPSRGTGVLEESCLTGYGTRLGQAG